MINPQELQTIRGISAIECKTKLREIYGEKNYQIVRFSDVYCNGIIARLLGRKECEVAYQVFPVSPPYNRSSPSSFEDEKQKILNIAPKTQAPYIADLMKKNESIEEKLDVLGSTIRGIAGDKKVHPTIKRIEEILAENEFSFSFINRISEKIKKNVMFDSMNDESGVHEMVMGYLESEIKIARPPPYAKPPRIIVLVGPTGVGKTTTIAKLAAKYRFQETANEYESSVRLVTIDRYRIAAIEQIKKYAEHLEIESSIAESADDITKIIKMDGGKLNVLLIDTIGYSPNDYEGIAKMHKILDVPGLNPEIYLTVSASTKTNDVQNILRNYEPFNYRSLIITKCDETEHIGNIISALAERNKTITYITNGQHVPKHLEEASSEFFFRKITGFSIDRDYIESVFLQNAIAQTTAVNAYSLEKN